MQRIWSDLGLSLLLMPKVTKALVKNKLASEHGIIDYMACAQTVFFPKPISWLIGLFWFFQDCRFWL